MKMRRFFKHFFAVGLFSLLGLSFVASAEAKEVKIFTSWKFNALVKHDLATDRVTVRTIYYNYDYNNVASPRVTMTWRERYPQMKELFSDPDRVGFAKIAIGDNLACSLRNDGFFRIIYIATGWHSATTSTYTLDAEKLAELKVKAFKILPDITPNVPWIVPPVIILQLHDNTFFPLFLKNRSEDRYLPRPPQFGYRNFFTEEDFADERKATLLDSDE
jgi:hypothetical protein